MSEKEIILEAFVNLGKTILKEIPNPDSDLCLAMRKAERLNPWFTLAHSDMALKNIAAMLQTSVLSDWSKKYRFADKAKKIGVLTAGNIPLVGFHDMLCVLISGNHFVGRLSSDDSVLMNHVLNELSTFNPLLKERILVTERLESIDAVIATGSNNTNRYFEYYFGKYPHLFRKNRNSVAFIHGDETPEEMKLLSDDIFSYFGLGCRNVSKIMVPESYDFHKFFPYTERYHDFINHNKYANNYHYHRTIYAMKQLPFLENGFLVLKEDASLTSPVSVVHYEFYSDANKCLNELTLNQENIQCLVMNERSQKKYKRACVLFGQTQRPGLSDYADHVDTMKFLESLYS